MDPAAVFFDSSDRRNEVVCACRDEQAVIRKAPAVGSGGSMLFRLDRTHFGREVQRDGALLIPCFPVKGEFFNRYFLCEVVDEAGAIVKGDALPREHVYGAFVIELSQFPGCRIAGHPVSKYNIPHSCFRPGKGFPPFFTSNISKMADRIDLDALSEDFAIAAPDSWRNS